MHRCTDGTRGVRAIKEQGGMVMVQDEATAKFDGMPRAAISTGVADFILPPKKMAVQLLAYIDHPYVTKKEPASSLIKDQKGLTRIFSELLIGVTSFFRDPEAMNELMETCLPSLISHTKN